MPILNIWHPTACRLLYWAWCFLLLQKNSSCGFLWIWLISGLWLWIGGRNGAGNKLPYWGKHSDIRTGCFFVFSGVFREASATNGGIGTGVVFVWQHCLGRAPFQPQVSWEGHLFGSLAGILVAFNYRSEGPKRKIYDWEKRNGWWRWTPEPGFHKRSGYRAKISPYTTYTVKRGGR